MRVKSEYHNVVSAMSELIERFVGDDNVEWLFKAFLEVIEKDTSIDKDFIIEGKQMSKSEVLNIDNTSLASFALGVWHYVVTNVKDNTIGQATFNNWHTKNGHVTHFHEQGKCYKVFFQKLSVQLLLQSQLNENAVRLGINTNDGRDVLDETAWLIKQMDLRRALMSVGIYL